MDDTLELLRIAMLETKRKRADSTLRETFIDIIRKAEYAAHDVMDSAHEYNRSLGEQDQTSEPKKPHVSIIIGHTHAAGGAYSSALGCNEYSYWSKVMKITNGGHKINTLVDTDNNSFTFSLHTRDKGIRAAYKEADKFKPAFTVELHFNASANRQARGQEVLCVSETGRKIANMWNIRSVLKRPNVKVRGVKQLHKGERGYYNLTLSAFPSILIEPFFGSNEIDSKYFEDKSDTYSYMMALIGDTLKAMRD